MCKIMSLKIVQILFMGEHVYGISTTRNKNVRGHAKLLSQVKSSVAEELRKSGALLQI